MKRLQLFLVLLLTAIPVFSQEVDVPGGIWGLVGGGGGLLAIIGGVLFKLLKNAPDKIKEWASTAMEKVKETFELILAIIMGLVRVLLQIKDVVNQGALIRSKIEQMISAKNQPSNDELRDLLNDLSKLMEEAKEVQPAVQSVIDNVKKEAQDLLKQ